MVAGDGFEPSHDTLKTPINKATMILLYTNCTHYFSKKNIYISKSYIFLLHFTHI